jgi:hypothetical protein
MADRAHGRHRRWVTATVGLAFIPLASAVALLSLNTLGTDGTSSKGFPHGMPTTQAQTINADLLAFVQS